jgi:hypothetical protein
MGAKLISTTKPVIRQTCRAKPRYPLIVVPAAGEKDIEMAYCLCYQVSFS